MARFNKITPREPWTTEKTTERIMSTMDDIKTMNKEMNGIDSKINDLLNRKSIIKRKISRKNRYVHQLTIQLGAS